ncbi:MAG: hypothetical protein Q6352_009710 [Candidatus Freyrarchaeum guaymaensis]
MKGRPRMFKSGLVKVTLRIPEILKQRIQEYAENHRIKFNEAARRLLLGGLDGKCLVEQRLDWFQLLFEGAPESPLFEEFRASFHELLFKFLSRFFEKNPEVLIRSIASYLEGHISYMESVLGLETGRLIKAVAGGNPEAEERMSLLLENIAWVKEWIHR